MMLLLQILFFLFSFQEVTYPLNKKHQPSSKGIEFYVETNTNSIITEFQNIVGDTLYDVYVYSSDLSLLPDYDSLDLGAFFIPNEIIITTQEKFIAYQLNDLSKYQKNSFIKANNFVKGTMLHELMHYYFYQVIKEMQMNQEYVSIEYLNFSMIPRVNNFGEKFIEEGVCELVPVKMNESIFPKKYYQPRTLEDINKKENKNILQYEYSVEYLRAFVDYFGFKKAIQLLVKRKPPTNNEILYPLDFFNTFK